MPEDEQREAKPVAVVIESALYSQLKETSEKRGFKINWMVNRAIAEWLERLQTA